MSVEDVIRVAQLKLREARLARVAQEAKARDGDIVDVTEYLKPGPEEIFGLLPPRLGRWALARVRHDRAWPLKVTTTRLSGFLRLKALAGLRRWRPRTLRFAEEEAWVERWLGLIERTLAVDPAAAREVVATAALVRGYADTYKRGLANWTAIMDGVVEPMLAGKLPRAHFADAVLQARLAATKDPEGEALAETIAAIGRMRRPRQDRRRVADPLSSPLAMGSLLSPRAGQKVPASAELGHDGAQRLDFQGAQLHRLALDIAGEADRRDAWLRMPSAAPSVPVNLTCSTPCSRRSRCTPLMV